MNCIAIEYSKEQNNRTVVKMKKKMIFPFTKESISTDALAIYFEFGKLWRGKERSFNEKDVQNWGLIEI